MHVGRSEMCIAALTGAVFGLVGYWSTRHIHNMMRLR